MKIEIVRNGNEVETKGKLTVFDDTLKDIFTCDTLELPDLNNHPQTSCIPKGTYQGIKVGATHNIPYTHISILNVPNRTGICIHIGNYASAKKSDVLGCILAGNGYSDINGDGVSDIINSKVTFTELMTILPDAFEIEIK